MTFRSSATVLLSTATFLLVASVAVAQTITGGYSSNTGTSRPVHELPVAVASGPEVIHHPFTPSHDPHLPDGGEAQTNTPSGALLATSGVSFNGLSVIQGGYIPSDNNIAVGPNHVVEVVNSAYAVYSKAGVQLLTARKLGSLWSSIINSPCSNNSGDTVVQYDRKADRWIITQLGSLSSPYSECVAVSKTNDPTTTAFNLYTFPFGTYLNDYPKWGVWPTATNGAYLATYNLFANGSTFAGAEICAYDRTAMLNGAASVGYVCATNISGASFLPIDLDGPTPPPDGTPAYFMDIFGSNLGVYKMSPNFATTPPSATLTGLSTIPVAGYTEANSSPQPNTTETLDSLSDRAMYRLAFRVFGDHESVVVNHSVVAGAGGNSGVRWYELRSPVSSGGSFTLYQQGTWAPDSNYRWMGSIAMDQAGDIGLGYSVSSTSTFPSVRYTGRIPTDGLGTMETEGVIINGTGSQTGYTRWGDYSSMRIDPADDCTFWYVNEYLPNTSSAGWFTRIGSFKFPNCGSVPDFSLSVNPASQTVTAGSPATSTIGVTAVNGYSGTVNLSIASGCPTNATCSFNPGSATPGTTSTLTVATAPSTPGGSYIVTLKGTDSVNSALTHTATFTVTVQAPDFSLTASPASATINPGQSATSTIGVTAVNGYSGTVNLTIASGCPTGATCSFNPTSVTPGTTSILTVATTASTTPGTYTVTAKGTDSLNSLLTHTKTFTVTVRVPDFSLTATPTSATINAGQSATSTIGVTALNGYSGTVNLSVLSGCPTGATCSVSPGNVTPGTTSTLTVTTTTTTTPGTYTVTVQGADSVNSLLKHTTTFSVTVRIPDFSLTATPTSATINPGQPATSTIGVTAVNGYSGTVNLTVASGCPTGATCSVNPGSATPGTTSTLTVTTTVTTTPGTYAVTVQGTDSVNSSLTHTTAFSVTIRVPDFSLTATPTSATINPGQSATSTIGATAVNGYSGSVNLSIASGCPTGATCSFSPTSVTPGTTSTLTVATTAATTPGTYTVTARGTDSINSSLTHTTTFSVTIRVPDFSLTATPTSATINPGQSATSTIGATAVNGYSGTVNLSIASGCPTGATCSFSPTSVTPGTTSTLTVATTAATTPGTYTVTAQGTDSVNSSLTHTTTFSVTIRVPDFSLTATPTSATINPGQSATSTIGATAVNGYSGTVNLTIASGCPTGATCSFNPTSVTPGTTSTLTVATTAATTPGTYTVTAQGTDSVNSSLTHTTTFSVTIRVPDFSLTATPTSATVHVGLSATSTISLTAINGYSGTVNLGASGCPSAATCSFNPASVTPGTGSTLTVATSSLTPSGSYPVTVTGTDSINPSLSHTTTFTVTVSAADFSIAASPTSFTTGQTESNTSTISVGSIDGFASAVSLSTTTCPTGATCSFSPSSITPGSSSTMTVTPSSSTPPGPYTVVVTGTSGGLSHSTSVVVTVVIDFSISAPAGVTVNRGSASIASVAVGRIGSSTPVTLSLSGVPANVTAVFAANPVPSGNNATLVFSAKSGALPGSVLVTITGTSGGVTHSTTTTLTIN